MKRILFGIAFSFFYSLPAYSVDLTAAFSAQGGWAIPQEEVGELIENGNSVRFHIFGGAKVTKSGSVGLGLDFTYSEHAIKGGGGGHYQRILWDWFFLPLGLGPLRIIPGIAWVGIDTKMDDLGVKEQSFRPAGVLGLELGLGVTKNINILATVRAERTMDDFEPVSTGGNKNITGDFVNALVGLEVRM
ncbi:MAG: hypothetical protein OEX00_03930 [Gammaproteobacteria bacterium]|nr:hypothetical protein [Gammaproteobacteria bacterium]MDH5693044.1 hypothetical protein [Gammaproteobacteria bacterium]